MIHIVCNVNEEGYFIATLCIEMKEIVTCGGETLSSAVGAAIRHAEVMAWEGLASKDDETPKNEDDDDDDRKKGGGLN